MGSVQGLVTWGITLLVILPLARNILAWATPSRMPIVNNRSLSDLFGTKARSKFAAHGRQIFDEAVRQFPLSPFQVYTDMGIMTILPPSMAVEVRNDPRLSVTKHTETFFMAKYPGFEGFRNDRHDLAVSLDVIKGKLTQSLAKVTTLLSNECTIALQDIFGRKKEWRSFIIKDHIAELVARLSSRVFVGDQLCHDPRWLDITASYTINAFTAADELRMWNPLLRHVVHWFLPRCRKLRAQIKEAYAIMGPVIEARKAQRAYLSENRDQIAGDDPNPEDAIEWFETLSRGRDYDPRLVQLKLSLAAIHTSTDLISQTLLDLAEHPELIGPLRDEIDTVLATDGWTKTAMFKMKLLDSIIKETQRMKPISFISMRREVTETMKLPDGSILQKGDQVAVSSQRMWDDSVHASPLEYDGYRFLKMRKEPGRENFGQLVTTSPDHLAFGHGTHACPGRFFAAHEVKIALAQILTEYDIRLLQDTPPRVFNFGITLSADPFAKLEMRKWDSTTA